MKTFKILDADKLSLIMEAFSSLDDIRWSRPSNYNLINYSVNDLSSDERLLTHWLCYITDRQMGFRRIWDVGGYVISHMVRNYTANGTRPVKDILFDYIPDKKSSLRMECPMLAPNERLKRYGFTGNKVSFASRYMPEDLVLFYRTLKILDKTSKRSFITYIANSINSESDMKKAIKKIAWSLYELTYISGGALSTKDFQKNIRDIDLKVANFQNAFDEDGSLFSKKRLWCSVRDYLKSEESNRDFVSAIKGMKYASANKWKRDNPKLQKALDVIELPGDVWNNSQVFRSGLFSPYLENERASWDMPKTVREIYKQISEQKNIYFYPEQLDVTFDFVPRMCESNMCDVCLFGKGVASTCHRKKGVYCPIALTSCGYRYECEPEGCKLKQDLVKELCSSRSS